MNGICVFLDGKIKGQVEFIQKKREKPVLIKINLKGFKKEKKKREYAIHIHEYGNLSNGCMSTGGHFNPFQNIHGLVHKEHHIGDIMSNISPNEKGEVHFNWEDPLLSLYPGDINCIIGRSIVIHEYPDDLGDWKRYETMSDKELLDFVIKRKYIKKKKEYHREKMIQYCIEQSKKTGNAGGRMTCGIIGISS